MGLYPRIAVVLACILLWGAGLRLFLESKLPMVRKVLWSMFLLMAGVIIGGLLSNSQIWTKFLYLLVLVPVLGVIDARIFHSRFGASFWMRACSFEICTVFGVAALTRKLLENYGVAPLLPRP